MFWLNSNKSSVRENISKSEKKKEMWSQVLLKSLQYNVQLGSTWIELNCVLLDPIWTISYQFPRMGGSTWGVDDDNYVFMTHDIFLCNCLFVWLWREGPSHTLKSLSIGAVGWTWSWDIFFNLIEFQWEPTLSIYQTAQSIIIIIVLMKLI